MKRIIVTLFSALALSLGACYAQDEQLSDEAVASFGNVDLGDEDILDVASITDAVKTPIQSLTELSLRFLINLLFCWIIVHCFYYRKSRRRSSFLLRCS